MKIQTAKRNGAFNRTKALIIVCLCVVAFEGGIRYAEKQFAPKPPITPKKPAVTVSSVDSVNNIQPITEEEPEIPFTPAIARVQPPPATNTPDVRPPATPSEPVIPGMIKGDGPITRRKVMTTNSGPHYATPPAEGYKPFGIRIALP